MPGRSGHFQFRNDQPDIEFLRSFKTKPTQIYVLREFWIQTELEIFHHQGYFCCTRPRIVLLQVKRSTRRVQKRKVEVNSTVTTA